MDSPRAKVYIVDENKDGGSCANRRLERLFALAKDYACGVHKTLPQGLKLAYNQHGKPHLENADWLHFSITHSGGLWGCAFSHCPVGLDMENSLRAVKSGVIKRFFHPKEQDFAQGGDNKDFFRVWTAKESYVKLLGTGIGGSFAHFSVVENGRISGEKLFANFYDIPLPKDIECAGDFIITLCEWED